MDIADRNRQIIRLREQHYSYPEITQMLGLKKYYIAREVYTRHLNRLIREQAQERAGGKMGVRLLSTASGEIE
jgi:hypothetical protein